jgi:hypothetical protein
MKVFSKGNVGRHSKVNSVKGVFVASLVLSLFFACGKDPENAPGGGGSGGSTACSSPAKSFAADVNAIIQTSCATGSGCHGSGSLVGPGPLLTYLQVFNARSSIRSAVSSGRMPPNGGLSATQKNSIICWIDSGAPNN